MPANLENSAVTGGLEKVNFHPNAKESSNYCTIALISHASKIPQARLQQYMNREFPDVQATFRKGRGIRNQWNCQHPLDHQKSKKIPEKHLLLLH